jgi:hypothetical protein
MPTLLTVRDASMTGKTLRELTIEFLTEHVTVRELIRARVFQEVKEHNAKQTDVFAGLVQPEDTEVVLNGFRMRKPRSVDFEAQFRKAIEAFDARRILLLVDDAQVDDLEREVVLRPGTDVAFLRLVPLIGG